MYKDRLHCLVDALSKLWHDEALHQPFGTMKAGRGVSCCNRQTAHMCGSDLMFFAVGSASLICVLRSASVRVKVKG